MTDPSTPEWARDAVFYQIFPDRFATSLSVPKAANLEPWGPTNGGNGYQGGDLLGVVERLDYLQDLGVNALYFTPIFQSACNHRYHTHDYEKVDPMLGGDAALRRLLDEAHRRGMHVVLDGVFNHSSRGFFQFNDILENGTESAYLDWFTVKDFPLYAYDHERSPNYGAWWDLHALPKFNIQTPAVRRFLLGVGRRWIDYGIDGWRLDVANEIEDDDFWREFRGVVRDGNPEAYIVGEVWLDSRRWLQGDMWDAVMNYLFTRACIAFFIGDDVNRVDLDRTALVNPGPPGAPAFAEAIGRLLGLYRPESTAVMMNLLDSHDMARFLTLANGDKSALRLATLFQMTYPGAPCIFYGDEVGLDGGHDRTRVGFPWRNEAWDLDLLHDFQKMIALRKAHPALRRGTYECLHAEGGTHVHLRRLDGDIVVVAMNTSKETRVIDLPLGEVGPLAEVWGKDLLHDGARTLKLDPRSGRVFASRTS